MQNGLLPLPLEGRNGFVLFCSPIPPHFPEVSGQVQRVIRCKKRMVSPKMPAGAKAVSHIRMK